MTGSDDVTVPPAEIGSTPTPAALFTPGQVIASRYRMVSLLGRGGMGEVYRADDLKLGTAVALKFLPRHVERDRAALARFHDEVRIARQVSHPHVCRVFDIGEVEGRHFLSMELVDGEDLATLLRRIGRLPPAKALELSRQLCSGLDAAHRQGVLHRDLKPANVMVDGHGRARIADFGLAVAGPQAVGEFAGTPAYMAPEQLAGHPASRASDVYALGLVLYEMFTGKRAFEATTVPEWRRVHADLSPAPPSDHASDVEPAVERVILQCLEKDPASRPPSAAHVARALPGSDGFALALAEGDTPSPAMVAAAGGASAFTSRQAWVRLGAIALGLAALVAVAPYSTDFGLAPMTKSPDVLRDRAQEVAARFGYREAPVDETWWLERDYDLLRWGADHLVSVDWRQRLRAVGAPVLLTYRRSGQPLHPRDFTGMVEADVPPAANGSGDVRVVVDGEGRLRAFVAAPPAWSGAASAPGRPDEVFQAAGLDLSRFAETTPQVTAPVGFDARREWEGTRADVPELPLRLSVAWFEGRVVYAEVVGPWRRLPTPIQQMGWAPAVQRAAYAAFALGLLAVAAELARRNLRAGRGDRRGALRIAAVAGVVSAAIRLVTTHVPVDVVSAPELVFGTVGNAVADAFFMWLLYVAVEPYGRRRVPALLVGWARMLEGRRADPGLAREVLLGLGVGVWLAVLLHVANGLPTVVPIATQTPVPGFTYIAQGRPVIRIAPTAAVLGALRDGLLRGVWSFMAVVAFRTLWRRGIAFAVTAAVFVAVTSGWENPIVDIPVTIVTSVTLAWVANYRGLLVLVVSWISYLLAAQGATLGVSPALWYGPHAWFVLVGLGALAFWMVRVSTGGRPGHDPT